MRILSSLFFLSLLLTVQCLATDSHREGGILSAHDIKPQNFEEWTLEDLREEYNRKEAQTDKYANLVEKADERLFEEDLKNRSCYHKAGTWIDNTRATLGYVTPVVIGIVNIIPIDPTAKQWASVGVAIVSLGINALGHIAKYYTVKASDIDVAYEKWKGDENRKKKLIADIIRKKEKEGEAQEVVEEEPVVLVPVANPSIGGDVPKAKEEVNSSAPGYQSTIPAQPRAAQPGPRKTPGKRGVKKSAKKITVAKSAPMNPLLEDNGVNTSSATNGMIEVVVNK